MLAAAIEGEVAEYIDACVHATDANGQRLVVRNGHTRRSILTGLGPIEVARPRVNDRRVDADGNRMRFTSAILPPYLRQTKPIDKLVPWLYLKGISTGDFPVLLRARARSSLIERAAPPSVTPKTGPPDQQSGTTTKTVTPMPSWRLERQG